MGSVPKARKVAGEGPGTTKGLLCSSLGRFGLGAPPSSPAVCSRDIPAGLSQATAASSVAGYLRQWTL